MRRRCIAMDQWRRLEDAHLILVGSRNFSRIGAAVQCRNTNVVVCGTRNDLDTFEGAGKDHDIATGRICLQLGIRSEKKN